MIVYATMVWVAFALEKDVSSAVAEVAARFPGQTQKLAAAAAGSPAPLVEEDLAHVAQLSYQPMRDQEMALDALHGRRAVLDWEHARPGFFDESQGRAVFHRDPDDDQPSKSAHHLAKLSLLSRAEPPHTRTRTLPTVNVRNRRWEPRIVLDNPY